MRVLLTKLRTWLGTGNIIFESPLSPSSPQVAAETRAALGISSTEISSTFTSLTGGLVTSLDALPTVGLPVNQMRAVIQGGVSRFYQLTASTGVTSLPFIVRPLDYNTSTNAKNWVLVSPDLVAQLPNTPNWPDFKPGGNIHTGPTHTVVLPAFTAALDPITIVNFGGGPLTLDLSVGPDVVIERGEVLTFRVDGLTVLGVTSYSYFQVRRYQLIDASALESALLRKVNYLPEDIQWTEVEESTYYLYGGFGGFKTADAAKQFLVIHNAGYGALQLVDPTESHLLTIAVGETVYFSIVDEGAGVFSFAEEERFTPNDPTKLLLTGGTLTGATSATGQPGDPGIGGTRQPTHLLTKRGADTLYAFLNDSIEWLYFDQERTTWIAGSGSGFSFEQYGGGRQAFCGAAASAKAHTRFVLHPEIARDVAIAGTLFFFNENNVNATIYFQWGTHTSATPGMEPTVLSAANLGHGFGLKSHGTLNSVLFYACNGTTYSEQSFSLTNEYVRQHHFLMINRAGTVEFWSRRLSVNNQPWVLNATLTTGPTAAPAIYHRLLSLGCIANSSNSVSSGVAFKRVGVRAINANNTY